MATLFIGLVFRIAITYIVVLGNKLTVKEKIFIALSWLPKATVQVIQHLRITCSFIVIPFNFRAPFNFCVREMRVN